MHVVRAKLLTYRNEFGGYVIYVFRNLEDDTVIGKYIWTIRFPNWNCPVLKVGDIGYLQYKEVEAGKTTWWDNNTQTNVFYKYDNIIFENFIPDKKEDLTVMLQIPLYIIRCTQTLDPKLKLKLVIYRYERHLNGY